MHWARVELTMMGTTCAITIGGTDAQALVDLAAYRIAELEARWSRFVDTSDVSRMNRAEGLPTEVAPDTITLVESAVLGRQRAGGSFDPTVLGAVIALGYDRSFEQLGDGGRERPPPSAPGDSARPSGATMGCGDIVVDHDRSTVTLPAGIGFDPGGIGKGLAADLIATEAIAAGAVGACVDLGGDVRVTGSAPRGRSWIIALPGAAAGSQRATVALRDGAVATSSPSVRRWLRDGTWRHHLVDPRTGRSTETDLADVSVIASAAWQADVLTKAVVVRGLEAGLGLVDELGAACRIVTTAGRVHTSNGWAAVVSVGGRTEPTP